MKTKKNDISEVTVTCKIDATFIIKDEDARTIAKASNSDLVESFTKTMAETTGADDILVKDLKVFITR